MEVASCLAPTGQGFPSYHQRHIHQPTWYSQKHERDEVQYWNHGQSPRGPNRGRQTIPTPLGDRGNPTAGPVGGLWTRGPVLRVIPVVVVWPEVLRARQYGTVARLCMLPEIFSIYLPPSLLKSLAILRRRHTAAGEGGGGWRVRKDLGSWQKATVETWIRDLNGLHPSPAPLKSYAQTVQVWFENIANSLNS